MEAIVAGVRLNPDGPEARSLAARLKDLCAHPIKGNKAAAMADFVRRAGDLMANDAFVSSCVSLLAPTSLTSDQRIVLFRDTIYDAAGEEMPRLPIRFLSMAQGKRIADSCSGRGSLMATLWTSVLFEIDSFGGANSFNEGCDACYTGCLWSPVHPVIVRLSERVLVAEDILAILASDALWNARRAYANTAPSNESRESTCCAVKKGLGVQ